MKVPAGGHENCPLVAMGSARHILNLTLTLHGLGPLLGSAGRCEALQPRGGTHEVCRGDHGNLEAYDLTGSFQDAAELAGCSHHTVAAYVARREMGAWAYHGWHARC